MKKTVLTLLLCLATMISFAAPVGTTQGNPIAFDFAGSYPENSANPWWFKIDVTEIKQMQNPTLALYMTNTSETESPHVLADIYVGQASSTNPPLASEEFDLAPGQYRIMSTNVSALKNFTYTEVYLRLTIQNTSDTVVLSAKKYETSRIDLACKSSSILNVGGSSLAGAANTESWYNFDIMPYTKPQDDSKDLLVIVTPNGGAAATVSTSLSYDCPCSGSTDKKATLAAGESDTVVVPGSALALMNEFRAYVKVKSTVAYTVKVVEKPSVIETVPSVTATDYDWESATGMDLVEDVDNWIAIPYDSLIQDLVIPTVSLTEGVTAEVKLATVNAGKATILQTMTWNKKSFQLDVNTLTGLRSVETVYYCIHPSAACQVRFVMNAIYSGGEDCESALDFTDKVDAGFEANISSLYEDYFGKLDLDYLRAKTVSPSDPRHVDVNVTIYNDAATDITVKVAQVNCEVALTDDAYQTKVIPVGGSYTRKIPYSVLLGLERWAYFRIKSTGEYSVIFSYTPAVERVEDVCAPNSTPFDWRYGHTQPASTDVWYEVDLDTVHNNLANPIRSIQNTGTGTAHVRIEYAYDCNIQYELAPAEVYTVGAGNTNSKTLTRESLMGIEARKYWVHITTDQPIFWQMNFEENNDLADRYCQAAIDFNWVGGNTQAANSTTWYEVDLSYAKAQRKMIQLHIDNLSSSEVAKVAADLSFKCPYSSLTHYSASIPAGASKPAVGSKQGLISYSMYEGNDAVWVRLESNQPIHVWAELMDDDMEPITVCDEATPFKFDETLTLTKDTTWFYFITDSLKSATFAPLTYVPQITIHNPLATKVTAKAEIAFHCPVTETMMSKSMSFAAGATYVNSVERDVIDGYINNHDTVFFRIIAKAGLEFTGTMVDPNIGEDCLHAINFQYGPTGYNQEAETMWYKIDVDAARGHQVTAGVKSLDDASQSVTMALYVDCADDALESATRTVSAGGNIERNLSDLLGGFAKSYIYLMVKSTGKVNVHAELSDLPKMSDSIHVCDSSFLVKIEPNVVYHQNAGDSVWYYINIAELDSIIVGDAEFVVTPCAGTVNVSAKQWWECATDVMPVEKGFKTSAEYHRELAHSMLASMQDEAWVLIKGDNCFDFILNAVVKNGPCNPIEFDWDYCNTVPAGSSLWYHVNVDTLLHNPDKDLQLTITNLEDHVTHVTVDSVRLTCMENVSLFGAAINKNIEALGVKTQRVDNTLLQDFKVGNTGLYFKVTTDGQVKICPELIPEMQDSVVIDTIREVVCFGSSFEDPYWFWPDSVDMLHNHTIDSLIRDTMFMDVKAFRYDGTFHGDSVRVYMLYVLDAPTFTQAIDSATLSTLVLQSGDKLSEAFRHAVETQFFDSINARNAWANQATAALSDSIYKYLADTLNLREPLRRDSVFNVYKQQFVALTKDVTPLYWSRMDSVESKYQMNTLFSATDTYVYWQVGTWNDITQKYENFSAVPDEYTDPFAFEKNQKMGVRISYVPTCYVDTFLLQDTLEIVFAKDTLAKVVPYNDTVCAPYAFTSVLGRSYTITKDTTVRDTVYYEVTGHKTDSIVVRNFVVYKFQKPTLEAAEYPEMKAGMALETAECEGTLRANFVADNVPASPIDTIIWKYSTTAKTGTYVKADSLSPTTATEAWVAYEMQLECGGPIVDTLHITLGAADMLSDTIRMHLCYGDSLISRNGVKAVADKTWSQKEWNDTIHNSLKAGITDQLFDSVYVYKLTTLVPKDSVLTTSICKGGSLTWFGKTYTTAQSGLKDTIKANVQGCDSIWGVLNLTVNPTYRTVVTDTLCYEDVRYVWHVGTQNKPYFANTLGAGLHKDSVLLNTVYGCDSMVVLNLHIGVQPQTVNETWSSCLGGDFDWAGHYLVSHTKLPNPGYYDFYDTIQSQLGCDSLYYHAVVHVPNPAPTPFSAKVCKDSVFVWDNGKHQIPVPTDVVGSFVYDDTITSSEHCDSILRLTYKVTPKYFTPETATICDNEQYTWTDHKNNIVYSNLTAGTYVFYDSLQTKGCGCDSIFELTLKVNPTYASEVFDTICSGTVLPVGPNGAQIKVTQSATRDEVRHTVLGCDSIITHHIWVRTTPKFPSKNDLDAVPHIVCGANLLLDPVNAAIDEFFEKNVTPENEQVASYHWEIMNGGKWNILDEEAVKSYTTGDSYMLRLVVETECGSMDSTTYRYTGKVEKQSSDNLHCDIHLPIVPKYDNWLILLNVNESRGLLQLNRLPNTFTENDVKWYYSPNGVIDENQNVRPSSHGASPSSDIGFYCTSNYTEYPLQNGYYYAVVTIPASQTNSCEIEIRTQVYHVDGSNSQLYDMTGENSLCGASGNPTVNNNGGNGGGTVVPGGNGGGTVVPGGNGGGVVPGGNGGNNGGLFPGGGGIRKVAPIIAPTLVQPGSTIYVYNLNPEIITTIEIYDTMGECVDRVEVSGQETYGYQTLTTRRGCFLMNISSADDTRALKYIVK